MELTQKDRLQMCMQLRILEKVDPANKENYELYREILEQGYEALYGGWTTNILGVDTETVDSGKSSTVHNTLTMYSSLLYSYNKLADKGDLNEDSIALPGFDGNNETDYMVFAIFLINRLQRYAHLKGHYREDMNSHMELVPKYKAMFIKYEAIPIEKRGSMSLEQIKDILSTR